MPSMYSQRFINWEWTSRYEHGEYRNANLAGTLGKFCVWIALRKGKVDAKTEMFLLLATDDAVMSWRRARCKWIPWMPTKTNHTRMLARTGEKEEDGHSCSGVFVVNGQFNPKLTPTVRKNKRERKAWDKIASLEIVFLLSVFFSHAGPRRE